VPDRELRWLVDDVEVARGLISSVDPLPAGLHRVELRYTGGAGGSAAATFTVLESDVRRADEWQPWDVFVPPTFPRALH
jgi:hypothetical protein